MRWKVAISENKIGEKKLINKYLGEKWPMEVRSRYAQSASFKIDMYKCEVSKVTIEKVYSCCHGNKRKANPCRKVSANTANSWYIYTCRKVSANKANSWCIYTCGKVRI